MAGRGKKYQYTDEQKSEIVRLARLNCHTRTIALAVGMSEDTLQGSKDMQAIIHKNRALHRIGVREGQAEVAKGSGKSRATMLIWQGKNALGQSDKHDHTTGGEKIQVAPVVVRVDAEDLAELGLKADDIRPKTH